MNVLHQCNLNLSAGKTVILPMQTTILWWIWYMEQPVLAHIALLRCQPFLTLQLLLVFVHVLVRIGFGLLYLRTQLPYPLDADRELFNELMNSYMD